MRPILSCAVTIFITILLTSVAHAHHNPKHGNLASLERMLPGAATVPGVASLDVPALRSGVDMTIATDSTATAITGLRLRTVELYPLDEVRLSWLGVATEARAFDRTRTRRYEVGSYSVAKNLESRWGLLLRLESAGVFSLVQSTSPDGKPENADRPCGSQSQFMARVAVSHVAWPRLSFAATANLEGDPFHLVSGRACIGQPPAWLAGETIGGEVGYRGETLTVITTFAHRSSRVSDTRGGFSTVGVAGPSLGLTIRIVL